MQTSATQPEQTYVNKKQRMPLPDWLNVAPAVGVVAIYFLSNTIRWNSTILWHLFNIIIWSGIAGLSITVLRQRKVKLDTHQSLLLIAGLAGAFQIAIAMSTAGFFGGFGLSPYRHDVIGLILNMLYVMALTSGLEFSRAAIISSFKTYRPMLAFVTCTLLFAVLTTPLNQFTNLNGTQMIIQQSGEVFIPALAENLLATYLVMTGGPLTSLAYRGVLVAFEYLSPILPDINWLVAAFIGTLTPPLLLWIFQGWLEAEDEDTEEEESAVGWWAAVAVVGLVLLWFNMGVFGIEPTMITGPSMEPELNMGDLVIVKEVPAEMIEVGDVIRYRYNGVYVLHRVVEVHAEDNGRISFITKGDNNNAVDIDPVSATQLEGRAVLTIPKVGLLSVGLRRVFAWRG